MGGKEGPVFLGTVLAVTDLPRTEGFLFLSSRRARIHVDESFGGRSHVAVAGGLFRLGSLRGGVCLGRGGVRLSRLGGPVSANAPEIGRAHV